MKKRQRRCNNTTEIRHAPVMTPLAAAVMTALYPVASTLAQEDQDVAEGADVEEIVVTGSRIRKDTFSSAAPMDTVLTETATVRGISDVGTMLQTTTVAMGSPQVNAASTGVFVENGGLGTSTISRTSEGSP